MTRYSFRFPTVWEDEHRLRFGIDTPIYTYHFESDEERRLASLIQRGVDAHELKGVSIKLGMKNICFQTFIDRLKPVISTHNGRKPSSLPTSEPVVVLDPTHTGEQLSSTLRSFGCVTPGTTSRNATPTTTFITIDRYVYDSTRLSLLAARGHRIIPVKFTDRSVSIGPLIDEDGPCGNCFNLIEREYAPAWLAWPEQVAGKPLPIESSRILNVTAGFILELLRRNHPSSEDPIQFRMLTSLQGAIEKLSTSVPTIHEECINHTMLEAPLAS